MKLRQQTDPMSLAQMLEIVGAIRPGEAVAITQQICRRAKIDPAAFSNTTDLSPCDARSIFVNATGEVCLTGILRGAPLTDVARAGRLLRMLLTGDRQDAGIRISGALRILVARATGEIDAPPFVSVHDFSSALERFEEGHPTEILRRLFSRCIDAERGPASRSEAGLERRLSTARTDTLRRLLRESDQELFELLADRALLDVAPRAEPKLPRDRRWSRRWFAALSAAAALMLLGPALLRHGPDHQPGAGPHLPTSREAPAEAEREPASSPQPVDVVPVPVVLHARPAASRQSAPGRSGAASRLRPGIHGPALSLPKSAQVSPSRPRPLSPAEFGRPQWAQP